MKSDADLLAAAAKYERQNTKAIADHLGITESEVQRRLHYLIDDLEKPLPGEKIDKGKRKRSWPARRYGIDPRSGYNSMIDQ